MCENCDKIKTRQIAKLRKELTELAACKPGEFPEWFDEVPEDSTEDEREAFRMTIIAVRAATIISWLTDESPAMVLGGIAGTVMTVEVDQMMRREIQAQILRDSAPFN